jgi:hypothetical protein
MRKATKQLTLTTHTTALGKNSTRKVKIVFDKNEDYEGGTPVMVYLFEDGQEYGSTWNCLMGEGTIDDQPTTKEEWAWLLGKNDEVNAFLETLEVA